ncbi:hypothetical protein OAV62_01915 [bacterium]|nr:hypothetical protein [bacterium]
MTETSPTIIETTDLILEKLKIDAGDKSTSEKLQMILNSVSNHKCINHKDMTSYIKQQIINYILESDMNLEYVPDVLEEQIYNLILSLVEKHLPLK